MSLFSDGLISSIEDLRKYDSSILDVASTEGIDLDSKLELSQSEIGIELIAFLLGHAPEIGRRRDLSHIYVTEPLRHWHALNTLELSYLDAHNTQLNDRYRGKTKEYSRAARKAASLLYSNGVGVVSSPIPKAGAPECATISGGSSLHIASENWSHVFCSGTIEGNANTIQCRLELAPGSSLDVCGVQLEPQRNPSSYTKSAGRSGIYTKARFDRDRLDLTSQGPNDHSVTVRITSSLQL
ncbi:MAG: hypothetical protein ACRD7E_29780 [Bryobacteraceae bacterium]